MFVISADDDYGNFYSRKPKLGYTIRCSYKAEVLGLSLGLTIFTLAELFCGLS
jgi:hypothetical protein